ncbi:hypothetical protein ACLOJK_026388 [Asimina triloba]
MICAAHRGVSTQETVDIKAEKKGQCYNGEVALGYILDFKFSDHMKPTPIINLSITYG